MDSIINIFLIIVHLIFEEQKPCVQLHFISYENNVVVNGRMPNTFAHVHKLHTKEVHRAKNILRSMITDKC